jgi:hypothetical protein
MSFLNPFFRPIAPIAFVVAAVTGSGCAAEVDDTGEVAGDTEQSLYGGNPVQPVEYEAVGQLTNGCGGTLITERGVLTAAHCVCNQASPPVCDATMGVVFRSVLLGDRTRGDVTMYGAVHVHPSYGHDFWGLPNEYDMAVIMLHQPVNYYALEVDPIWVQSWQPSVGLWARVIGWGQNDDDCTTGLGVKRTALYRIDERDDRRLYFDRGSVHYCAGDSGGPIIDQTYQRVVGVNSQYRFDAVDFPPHTEDIAVSTPPLFDWIASKACWYDPYHYDLWNQCSNPLCPCDRGQGDCDASAECKGNLVCNHDIGANYGLPWDADVCECPTFSPWAPDANFCTQTCPCDHGEGHCQGDWECADGLVCGRNLGSAFGLPASFGVCVWPGEQEDQQQCPNGWSCCESWGTTCTQCIPPGAYCQ